ncbi:hypothetical protein ACERII_05745 [Evansella sp. AB-rgal1]|uniref:hypothetical protein n=1 Tax=Evansella sp. AB-rgal1 TaxID=3242696 RepID=UPI00359D513C
MEQGMKPLVVVIASFSGGGKTTITNYVNDRIENSKALFFDDYDFEGPDDIISWVDNGADYDEWNLSPLISDVQVLLSEPLDFILLDFPFAYKHSKMSKYIDIAVFIDTPLDIAMARRLLRDSKNSSGESIAKELEYYLTDGRRGYLEMQKTIKPSSDFIVDGADSVATIAEKMLEVIQGNNFKNPL